MHNKINSNPSKIIRSGEKKDIPSIMKLWIDTINWHAKLDNDFLLAEDGILKDIRPMIRAKIYEFIKKYYPHLKY